ncbi:HET-domain-containing protein [Diplogelasinospora grovesii]|uniref:HET-domain-containing protein n=1 Tax=Diplogelasinospora grovesii TaxID=303347 RepID=A0AAN6MY95_9PEZI|nr:HET-domain-containing protein [Diplogelasinospora grovesii]
MRLLTLEKDGELSLTKDLHEDTPPYAIFSHTWGKDEEEVTFEEVMKCRGQDKAGVRKIRFCGEQAARDGLQYFWVDTCCIDKPNITEFTKAIISMYRWYQNWRRCYIYLSDVSTMEQASSGAWEAAFRKSRWFTRGWTLQEIIAPRSVEFFSSECQRLGDKNSLERQLHEITGIPVEALRGAPPTEFSIKERMTWGKSRRTKREEDQAYSLQGIFDICMPPWYGEGKERAFRRLLTEINNLSSNVAISSYQSKRTPPNQD